MRHEEMLDLVGFLRGAFPRLSEEQVELYSAMLLSEDASLASRAILSGINEWRFPPTWAEIVERIRALRRAQEAGRPSPVEEALAAAAVPAWVKQWWYARHVVDPPDLRPFREQHPFLLARGEEPAEGWMPSRAYVEESSRISDRAIAVALARGPRATLKELLAGP